MIQQYSISTLPPMRGIKQALCELRAADPNTALTERGLRRLILTGAVPSVRIGRKYLINMNNLYSYLNGCNAEPVKDTAINGIRRIAE